MRDGTGALASVTSTTHKLCAALQANEALHRAKTDTRRAAAAGTFRPVPFGIHSPAVLVAAPNVTFGPVR